MSRILADLKLPGRDGFIFRSEAKAGEAAFHERTSIGSGVFGGRPDHTFSHGGRGARFVARKPLVELLERLHARHLNRAVGEPPRNLRAAGPWHARGA